MTPEDVRMLQLLALIFLFGLSVALMTGRR